MRCSLRGRCQGQDENPHPRRTSAWRADAGRRQDDRKGQAPGANQYKDRVATKPEAPPTLAEAGIDKNLAHCARTLAALPEKKFEELLGEKRHRQDRRVVMAPEVKAEADTAERDVVSGERTAEALAAENGKLSRLVAALRREVKRWKERAERAGWKESADASPGGG